MQSGNAVTIAVENLRPGLLSEAETSDPSVVSKRRRLGPTDVGKICCHAVDQQILASQHYLKLNFLTYWLSVQALLQDLLVQSTVVSVGTIRRESGKLRSR